MSDFSQLPNPSQRLKRATSRRSAITRRMRAAWILLGAVGVIVIPLRAWEIAAAHNTAFSFFACIR
ncbi:hypothetical protein [Xanthomonas arboricola]|uniref:hypothetical protein n=1 Tax=Xanthomonas arboricola TaxID=56448 RepID=UPI003EBFD350